MRVPALIASVALALANLCILLSSGYARVAERQLDSPDASGALAAANIARDLHPWASEPAALAGWALAEARDADGSQTAYARALHWAPGEPLLWAEYALARARVGRFDAPLTQATGTAAKLAPLSPAVQGAIADLGVSYWRDGTPEQRQQWLSGMRYELAHSRRDFLDHVMARGRGRTFCEGPAAELGETKWCATVASALLGGCYTPTDKEPVPCDPQ